MHQLLFSSSKCLCRCLQKWFETFWDDVPGSSLAVIRIFFGILMLFDLQEERGMSVLDERFGDLSECRFPLFEILQPPPPLQYVALGYFAMAVALVCTIIGCRYFRVACGTYSIIFWLIFLADKTRWNNHSYLYGLISILITLSSAHHCLSWSRPTFKGSVPRWNYIILKFQVFLVYFYAGVKKVDIDWISGYSMRGLGDHWVWEPLRCIGLTEWFIEYVVVHLSGLIFDLSAGFLLIWNRTRFIGILLTLVFNGLNSRMFAIGMFPYVMIAFLPLFFDYDWPMKFKRRLISATQLQSTQKARSLRVSEGENSDDILNEEINQNNKNTQRNGSLHAFLIVFAIVQLCLPFTSSWLFPGYDTWTGGLYGHQWNMMVHNWRQGHIRFSVRHIPTMQVMYLDYRKLTRRESRWFQQADMVWQFAHCVKARLERERNLTDIEIRADVWMSLNSRFMQRMFDPRVDLLQAEWSPFSRVSWVVPVQRQLDHLRQFSFPGLAGPSLHKDVDQQRDVLDRAVHTEYLLDLPGMTLNNFISPELELVHLAVLKGRVLIVIGNHERNITEGQVVGIPTGVSHSVLTISEDPCALVYRFINKTAVLEPKVVVRTTKRSTVISRIAKHLQMWNDSFTICWWALQKIASDITSSLSR